MTSERSAVEATEALETVQEAAVEHALAAGDARRALALAGALEPLRRRTSRADDSDPDPVVTALYTTLSAWVALRERFGSVGTESPPAPPEPGDFGLPEGEAESAAVRGAAVACARFDVPVARAASLAGCSRSELERQVASLADEPAGDRSEPATDGG
ncbi:hypothetical protein [Halobaculum sp. P14]|uniref:hypothetical protein n=1 Tax=Halobaculum sp. P14 TaxID=3421638 RepID=UPI003EBF665C